MPSFIAWLDASERERRLALDVIELFNEKETLDELGIGSIRDTIAEVLSPGTSTIQTRARYFFFVPWTYLELERKRDSSDRVNMRARRLEVKTIEALSQTEENGVIGKQAGAGLRRLPSTIYWAGLGRLGFRRSQGSLDQYHRTFTPRSRATVRDESGDVDLEAMGRETWDLHLPSAPEQFPAVDSLSLTLAEAKFFSEKLAYCANGSLLHTLVERNLTIGDVPVPWLIGDLERMPLILKTWLDDGRCYSDIVHGAQLLYNLMLARKFRDVYKNARGEELTAKYEVAFSDWASDITASRPWFQLWDTSAFWSRLRLANPGIADSSINFSIAWITATLDSANPAALAGDAECLALIKAREWEMKKSRARLANHEQLQMWGGASGNNRLDYRWRITKQIVNDIIAGLGK